jgi:hypothetical protein
VGAGAGECAEVYVVRLLVVLWFDLGHLCLWQRHHRGVWLFLPLDSTVRRALLGTHFSYYSKRVFLPD